MKKFLFSLSILVLCICLVGCASQSDQTISQLSSQLDKTSNTISSFASVAPSEISFDNSVEASDLQEQSEQTQSALLDGQYYKAQILEKTAQIKAKLSKDVNLSAPQRNALKEHILTLEKYTKSIDESKKDMDLSVKYFPNLKRDTSKNKQNLQAKLNQLSCNENLRTAYYQNLLNTLDNIENCLDSAEIQSTENETPKTENNIRKNIDTYRPIERPIKTPTDTQPTRNIDTYGPRTRNIDTFRQPYGYGMYPNGYGMPFAQPYNMPYNMPYGYGGYNNFTNPYNGLNSNNINRLDYEKQTMTIEKSEDNNQISEDSNDVNEESVTTSAINKEIKNIKKYIDKKAEQVQEGIAVAH